MISEEQIKQWAKMTLRENLETYGDEEDAPFQDKELANKLIEMLKNSDCEILDANDYVIVVNDKDDQTIEFTSPEEVEEFCQNNGKKHELNEVSDIDVDWDDETLDKMTQKDLKNLISEFQLDEKDAKMALALMVGSTEGREAVKHWGQYFMQNKSSDIPKGVQDFFKSQARWSNSSDNTYEIKLTKDEEGV